MYCTGGTEYLSHTPGSHSVCAVRILLGVNPKILSIKKEPILSGLLDLNAWNSCLTLELRGIRCFEAEQGRCPGFDSQRLPAFSLSSNPLYSNVRQEFQAYINAVFTQFRLPHSLLQVMANAYLHFCSHSRGSGRAGRKRQDTPPSPVAGIRPVKCGETCLLN